MGCRCAMSWCNLDLTLDLVVTFVLKSCLGNILETVSCRKLIVCSDIAWRL